MSIWCSHGSKEVQRPDSLLCPEAQSMKKPAIVSAVTLAVLSAGILVLLSGSDGLPSAAAGQKPADAKEKKIIPLSSVYCSFNQKGVKFIEKESKAGPALTTRWF